MPEPAAVACFKAPPTPAPVALLHQLPPQATTAWVLKPPAAQAFGIKHVLNPNAYRGAFGNDGQAYARDVQDMIETATSGRVAGYISESIQGVGGCTPLADGYLPAVYEVRSELNSWHRRDADSASGSAACNRLPCAAGILLKLCGPPRLCDSGLIRCRRMC